MARHFFTPPFRSRVIYLPCSCIWSGPMITSTKELAEVIYTEAFTWTGSFHFPPATGLLEPQLPSKKSSYSAGETICREPRSQQQGDPRHQQMSPAGLLQPACRPRSYPSGYKNAVSGEIREGSSKGTCIEDPWTKTAGGD